MFILSDEPVLHRREWPNDAGQVFAITFREMTDEERERFDHEFSEIQNVPGDTPEDYTRKYDALMARWGATLIVDWEGMVDKAGAPVPVTDETKRKFCGLKKSLRYWRVWLFRYLWPSATAGEGEKRLDPPKSSAK